MNNARISAATVAAAIALAGAALGAGYWLGQNPPAAASGQTGEASHGVPRQPLYYRNPMGLPDTSPVPKKDEMGMDYIPVYAGEEEIAAGAGAQLAISVDKVQKLGVKTEPATRRVVDRVVRAVGRVEIDERRSHVVAPKFEGWIERLHVNTSGQPVARGQALLDVYSPDLVAAQNEYAIARQAEGALQNGSGEAQAGMRRLAEASLARLKNWDIGAAQLQELEQGRGGNARRTLTLRAPASGIVIEKKALPGMRFMPGEALFQIADLSSVWVIADVFERDLAQLKPGQSATLNLAAWPGERFTARVAYIYPTLNAQTRTVPVRLELANPRGLLKPAMYADVIFATAATEPAHLTIPNSAVIRSGTRDIALVQTAPGRYTPREIRLGAQGDTYVEVLDGISEGEQVVVTANFLLDAESNLRAALAGFGTAASSATPAPAVAPGPAEHAGHQEH